MAFPLHLLSVRQTSRSTMKHLLQASATAHTFCILGFFCCSWETAWWSGIMRICLSKSCPLCLLAGAVGIVEGAMELGLYYGSTANNLGEVTWESFFLFVFLLANMFVNIYLLELL